jgi:hypothetical protein
MMMVYTDIEEGEREGGREGGKRCFISFSFARRVPID